MRTKGPAHAETRQQILEVARKLVLRDGHQKLSLREVARESGFSAPSLYEYFPNKQAIVDALAAQVAGKLFAALGKSLDGVRSERVALVALGTAYVAWARKHPQDFLLMFTQLGSKRKSTAQAPGDASPYSLVLAAATRAKAAGVVHAAPETVAYAVWSAAHGMAMLQLTHLASFDADFESADRASLDALIAGFGPR